MGLFFVLFNGTLHVPEPGDQSPSRTRKRPLNQTLFKLVIVNPTLICIRIVIAVLLQGILSGLFLLLVRGLSLKLFNRIPSGSTITGAATLRVAHSTSLLTFLFDSILNVTHRFLNLDVGHSRQYRKLFVSTGSTAESLRHPVTGPSRNYTLSKPTKRGY